MAQSLDKLNKNTPIAVLKLHAEASRVLAAKNDMLLLIREREDELERLKANVINQDKRLSELEEQIEAQTGEVN